MKKHILLIAAVLVLSLAAGGCAGPKNAAGEDSGKTVREDAAGEDSGKTVREDAAGEHTGADETAGEDAGTAETVQDPNGAEEAPKTDTGVQESAAQERGDFVLSESGKEFLDRMCYYMPEFSGEEDWNETFWQDFLFYSYTGRGGDEVEMTTVKRPDMGDYEETVVKVSREEVAAYVKLALGIELPVFEPAFEDMPQGRTALFYEDGYYYIGVSDFGKISFSYHSCEDRGNGTYKAVFDVVYMDEEENGKNTVEFLLAPLDNENGFVIREKEWKNGVTE